MMRSGSKRRFKAKLGKGIAISLLAASSHAALARDIAGHEQPLSPPSDGNAPPSLDAAAGFRGDSFTLVAPRMPPAPVQSAHDGDGTPQAAPIQAKLAEPAGPVGNSTIDAALYFRAADNAPQLEVGALGGGMSSAPSLVHVGLNWDF